MIDVLWDPAAIYVFYRLSPSVATVVARALVDLVERGEGEIEWVAPYHRLHAGKHDLALTIDPAGAWIAVIGIYRARP